MDASVNVAKISNEVKKSVSMEFSKATKHTFVYETLPDQENPVVRSVYVAKSAMPSSPPPTIEVTVSFRS